MSEPIPPILYRDERIVVLDKPTGLLSVPGIGPDKADCLARRVARAHPGARIVHRLDRDTSGVIIMALDAEAHRDLSMQFQARLVEKRYEAVVWGVVAADEGEIDRPLRKDLIDTPRQIIDYVRGRPSVTRYRVLEREADRTRVALEPLTGRAHQLRVHLLSLGHPIIGDDLYAPAGVRDAAPRLLLHAAWLRVIHPSTASPMAFESACPF